MLSFGKQVKESEERPACVLERQIKIAWLEMKLQCIDQLCQDFKRFRGVIFPDPYGNRGFYIALKTASHKKSIK